MIITDLGILNLTKEQESKIGRAHHFLPEGITGYTRINGHHAVEGSRDLTLEEIDAIRASLQAFIPPLTDAERAQKEREEALKNANDFESFKRAVLEYLGIQ